MSHSSVQLRTRRQFALTVGGAASASIGLFLYCSYRLQSLTYSYLLVNVFLAALPLLFALRLNYVLQHKRWSDWTPIGWTLLWLLFVPNSFYMVSDYIHLRGVAAADILYVAVMFTSFIYLGVLLGFSSLYLVHRQLRQRMAAPAAAAWVGGTLLLCSMAIYIGRDLRWNSWDVIVNPAGLLFDVSDRLLHPNAYPEMFFTIGSFFVLLSSLYAVIWAAGKVLRQAVVAATVTHVKAVQRRL